MTRRDNTRWPGQIKLTQSSLTEFRVWSAAGHDKVPGTRCRVNLLCIKPIPLDAVRGLDQHVRMPIVVFIRP